MTSDDFRTGDEDGVTLDDETQCQMDADEELWDALQAAETKALEAHYEQHHGPIEITSYPCQ